MRKNCERFVAAILSASMLLSICMPGAVAVTAEEEDPTNYVEVLPVTYEAPENDETPVKTPEPIDVTIETDGSVTVGDRPEATPDEPEVEWKGEAEHEGEDGSIKAEVTGSETYTPSETITAGPDQVLEEGGETKGEEKIEIGITETPKEETTTSDSVTSDYFPETKKDEQTGTESGGVSADVTVKKDNEGNSTGDWSGVTDTGTWNLTEDDLRDLVTKPEAPTEEGWVAEGENKSTSSSTVTDEDGTVTTTEKNWERKEYTNKTEDGALIAGYEETTVETVTENGKIAPDMSDRPENAKDVTTKDGMVGYQYTETETLEDGTIIKTTYTVYPEQGSYTKTTTTTTTKLTYAKETEPGKITISNVSVSEGDQHGSLSGTAGTGNVQGPQADPNKEPGDLQFGSGTGLRDYISTGKKADGIGNNDFIWDTTSGVGDISAWAGSIYEIKTTGDVKGNEKVGHPALYVVRSPKKDADGKIIEGEYEEYYVYCADRGQLLNGQGYNLENLQDSKYFDSDEWKKIESIAVNGYWGVKNEDTTDEDPTYGSLDAFKAMLKTQNPEYWDDTKLEKLNDGMALTVTQAAIWKYASSHGNTTADGSTQKNPDVVTQNPFFDTKVAPGDKSLGQSWAGGSADATDEQKLLYQAYQDLLAKGKKQLEESDKVSTDLIDAEDITNIKVTINNKNEDDTYDTDLSFTLDVQPDRMNADDLMVTVKLSDGTNYTYRLEGAAKEGEKTADKTTGENDITYVLKGIQMKDGTTVSINLSGVQNLGKSAYLLTAEGGYDSSQSFVGVFEGERKVDVNVKLNFDASQPTATITTDTVEETVTKQVKQTSWASSWLSKFFYPADPEEPETPKDPETPKTPEIPVEPETPEDPEDTEEVVGAATSEPKIDSVPKTGDDASVWMVLCVLSAAGLAVLNLPKKKTEH